MLSLIAICRVGPVDEQKVDVVHLKRFRLSSTDRCRAPCEDELGPHLGGHEDVVAPDPGGANACTDSGLVVIALRGIDMAEADLQRLGDDGAHCSSRNSQVPQPRTGMSASPTVSFRLPSLLIRFVP